MKFYDELINVLKSDKRFFSEDGEILKNVIYESAMKMDEELINLLYSNDILRENLFTKVNSTYIFDKIKFGWIINNKEFLPDNYTRFKNKIGLTKHDEYICGNDDISLAFPYKDCILEFDSTDETKERKEMFYNENLMKSEINRLLYPKVFTNSMKNSKGYSKKALEIDQKDNLIIKGNNLLALYSLLPKYEKSIKCMYWDILYNTNNDKVPYNDSFKHSSWLVMMKNRLEVAHKLLSKDGTLFIQCDDIEMAYLKVLCDEIFQRKNYVNTITIKTKVAGVSGSSEGKSLIDATEFILVYAKNKEDLYLNPVKTKTPLCDLVKFYKENNISWKYTSIIIELGERVLISEDKQKGYKYFKYPNAIIQGINQFMKENNISEEELYTKYYDRIFRTTNAQSSVRKDIIQSTQDIDCDIVSIEYKPIKGKNKDTLTEIFYRGTSREMFMLLKDSVYIKNKIPYYASRISTLWDDIEYNNLAKEGSVSLTFGKKPEKLVQRIIELATDENDIVLDAYLGSGTTAAVAHKLHRQYIGIEQLDRHINLTLKRMKNVINGDNFGISKDVNWKGGGSYIYTELKVLNQKYIEKISKIKTKKEVSNILTKIINSEFISEKVKPMDIEKNVKDFEELSLDNKKKFLIELLDKNMLYVNLCDIDDEEFNISEEDKKFNKSFYGEV